jgi:hypothetical protein
MNPAINIPAKMRDAKTDFTLPLEGSGTPRKTFSKEKSGTANA